VVSILALFCLQISSINAAAVVSDNIQCGDNPQCLIVDTMEVEIENVSFFTRNMVGTKYSYSKAIEAWYELTRNRGCNDVSNIVVGGTFSEDGAPSSSIPGNFANHIYPQSSKNKQCTIVVQYSMTRNNGNPVIVLNHHDRSVELGRRALASVIRVVDFYRTYYGKTGPLNVWGLSKGAAVVASLWYQEAQSNSRTIIEGPVDEDAMNDPSVPKITTDSCVSNNCYYMGFGYPHSAESNSIYSLSRKAAYAWRNSAKGYMYKASINYDQYWRLTKFVNYSDPVFDCASFDGDPETSPCGLAAQDNCHKYGRFLKDQGYARMIKPWSYSQPNWENEIANGFPGYRWINDYCGNS